MGKCSSRFGMPAPQKRSLLANSQPVPFLWRALRRLQGPTSTPISARIFLPNTLMRTSPIRTTMYSWQPSDLKSLGTHSHFSGPTVPPLRALVSHSTPRACFQSATRTQRCTAPKQGPAFSSQPKSAHANATRKAYGSTRTRRTTVHSASTASTDSAAWATSISSWEGSCTTTPCSKSGFSRKRPSGSRCPPRRWQPPPEA